MRIVIFDGTFQTTPFIRRLINGLAKKGNKIYVLGFNIKNSHPVKGAMYYSLGSNHNPLELIKKSIQLQGVKSFGNIIKANRKQLQKKNFECLLEKIKPDIIHAQWNSVLPWLEPYLENKSYPIILSQRGYHTNVRPFVNKKNYAYLQQIYPLLSGLHSVSKAISAQGKKIGVPFRGIDKVVYTGLNFGNFEFRAEVKQSSIHKILSVGRPHWKKGYLDALQAINILKEKNINFEYTIIGGKGDEELLYFINTFQLGQQVNLLPKLTQNDVFRKMEEASVFLLPSIEEGIANVAVEAMALGTPVISTDCGGMEELITHEQEGWIVPKRNPIALAQQIEQFTKFSTQEIERIRHAARLKVEHQFNETQMVEGMQELYLNILQNGQ